MMRILAPILIVAAIAAIIVCVYLIANRKRAVVSEIGPESHQKKLAQAPAELLNLVHEIEIENRSGDKIALASVSSENSLSTKKFQEITASGSAIGAGLVQGAMPVLAQAQTLSQIAQAAPNGLFTSTAPLSELMKYKDGSVGSIVMKNGKIANHAGFQEVALQAAVNPAMVVAAGMQAMAMISGQYYMHTISEQLEGIERGIDKLIGFHHDQNIGKLRSVENAMKRIVDKQHVDEADIIALQAGVRDADSVLMEYSTRLERLRSTGEITDIKVRKLLSRLSAAKEIHGLQKNADEQELFYSFQICLFASKLITEGKKAEFATRMKMGETEKAMEAFDSYRSTYTQSFIYNAADFLDNLFAPIHAKAEALIQGQWMESKSSSKAFASIKDQKDGLLEYIGHITGNAADEKMIGNFCAEREILYMPAVNGSEQRIFISVEADGDGYNDGGS